MQAKLNYLKRIEQQENEKIEVTRQRIKKIMGIRKQLQSREKMRERMLITKELEYQKIEVTRQRIKKIMGIRKQLQSREKMRERMLITKELEYQKKLEKAKEIKEREKLS